MLSIMSALETGFTMQPKLALTSYYHVLASESLHYRCYDSMHSLAIKDVWTSYSSSLGLWPEARPWKMLFPRPLNRVSTRARSLSQGLTVCKCLRKCAKCWYYIREHSLTTLAVTHCSSSWCQEEEGVLTLFRVSSFPQHSPDLLLLSSYVYQYFPHTSGICSALNPSVNNCLKWSLLISYRQTIVTGHRTGRKLCRKLRLLLPCCMNFFNSCSLCPLLSDLPFILPSPVSTEALYKVTESEELKKNNCFAFA